MRPDEDGKETIQGMATVLLGKLYEASCIVGRGKDDSAESSDRPEAISVEDKLGVLVNTLKKCHSRADEILGALGRASTELG